MKRIRGAASNDVYRVLLDWLSAPLEDRMPAKALASDLGLTTANLYQRVSRLKRMRGKRIATLRTSLEAVPHR